MLISRNKYRGTTYSDNKGNYCFKTILPVPYDVGDGNVRPAHFHMMITAPGYQPLVTQLYFTGDPWLDKDSSSSSPTAKRRILEVQNRRSGFKKVEYNVSMSERLAAEPAAIDRLVGIYTDVKNTTRKMELIRKDNQLWMKGSEQNGMPFGMNFEYIGDNTFSLPGMSVESYSIVFEVGHNGVVKMHETYTNDKGEKETAVSVRQM